MTFPVSHRSGSVPGPPGWEWDPRKDGCAPPGWRPHDGAVPGQRPPGDGPPSIQRPFGYRFDAGDFALAVQQHHQKMFVVLIPEPGHHQHGSVFRTVDGPDGRVSAPASRRPSSRAARITVALAGPMPEIRVSSRTSWVRASRASFSRSPVSSRAMSRPNGPSARCRSGWPAAP